MSRSQIPGFKSISKSLSGLKRQVCFYGFYKNDLNFIKTNQNKGFLEENEDIDGGK